jgi:hypothetical protein
MDTTISPSDSTIPEVCFPPYEMSEVVKLPFTLDRVGGMEMKALLRGPFQNDVAEKDAKDDCGY